MGKSPDKGTLGVSVQVELKSGPDAGSTIEYVSHLTDKRTPYTTKDLKVMGWDGRDPASVMSKDFIVVIKHEEYTDKQGAPQKRAVIQWINDPSVGGRLVPISDPAELAAANAILAAGFAASAQGAPSNGADQVKF
jgi:hypothetical protein